MQRQAGITPWVAQEDSHPWSRPTVSINTLQIWEECLCQICCRIGIEPTRWYPAIVALHNTETFVMGCDTSGEGFGIHMEARRGQRGFEIANTKAFGDPHPIFVI